MTNFRTVKKNGKKRAVPISSGTTRKAGRRVDIKQGTSVYKVAEGIQNALTVMVKKGYAGVRIYRDGSVDFSMDYDFDQQPKGDESVKMSLSDLETTFDNDGIDINEWDDYFNNEMYITSVDIAQDMLTGVI